LYAGKLVNSTEKLDQTSEPVFETNVCNKNANPNKRPRACISDSSDHSVCIEKDLEEIKKSMEKIVKKDDIAEMATNIMEVATFCEIIEYTFVYA
jgi:hypothetical protein